MVQGALAAAAGLGPVVVVAWGPVALALVAAAPAAQAPREVEVSELPLQHPDRRDLRPCHPRRKRSRPER